MLVLSTLLFGLTLLASPKGAAIQAPIPACTVGTRYVELTAEAPHQTPEVCIRPELSLTLFFDTKLARVDVEGRERFRRVEAGQGSLTLVASDALRDGARVPVMVSFEDDAVPTSATFILVVHPSLAERQVEVSRRERTLVSYRQGEQQARAEVQQCQRELARFQTEFSKEEALSSLILDDRVGKAGIITRDLKAVSTVADGSLVARNVISYRAIGTDGKGRVAVEVLLLNQGPVAWTPLGAALLGARGEGSTGWTVWPREPIPPGREQRIVVERDAAEREAQGVFTLKLWAEGADAESVSIDGVSFPSRATVPDSNRVR